MRERKLLEAYRSLVLIVVLSLASLIYWVKESKKVWFSADIVERIRNAQTVKIDTEEMEARREAERKIEESGRATCEYCEEEIAKNDGMPGGGWVWESERLVGYCEKGGGHKHKPLVTWKPEEGVVNV